MENDLSLPVGMMRPVDIRRLNEPGIVLPIQPNDPIIAVTRWDESLFAILLNGPHQFSFFQIDATSRFSGLFVPKPEIIVSLSSATRGEAVWEKSGTLILENGRANVVGNRAGDHWGDAVNVPLWQEIDFQSSEGKTVGFSQWRLRVVDGDERHTIWQSPDQNAQPE